MATGTTIAARKYATAGVNAEGAPGVAVRTDIDGMQFIKLLSAKNIGLAEDGTLFAAETPTPGTGVKISIDAATAIVATAPSLLIVNGDSTKSIILDAIKLIVTGAGAGLSTLRMAMYIDLANRYTSGGSAITPVNLNTGIAAGSVAKFYDASTAIVAPAASSLIRKVDSLVVRSAIPVVNDMIILEFGGTAGMSNGASNGTAPLNLTFPVFPVVIGPGHSFLLYVFAGSMSTAPAFEYAVTWVER